MCNVEDKCDIFPVIFIAAISMLYYTEKSYSDTFQEMHCTPKAKLNTLHVKSFTSILGNVEM